MSDPAVTVQEDEEAPGVVSMMRRGVRAAIHWGGALTAAGIVLSFGMLALKRYDLIPVAVAMISGGPALIALSLGAKAWQAQAEKK